MKGKNNKSGIEINNERWSGKGTIQKYLQNVLNSSIIYDENNNTYIKNKHIDDYNYPKVISIFEYFSGKKVEWIDINHTKKIRNFRVKFENENARLYSYRKMFLTDNARMISKLREHIQDQINDFRKKQQLQNGKYICAIDGLEYEANEIEVDHVVEFCIILKNFIEIYGPLERNTFKSFRKDFWVYHINNAELQIISKENHKKKTRDFVTSYSSK
ncbi:hypothetical protein [Gluconobacter cerinus]|uniref:hypothetical protein n=1 Tax=Gluconobacter cerinus TaxID=38307 RepID=UPI001B8CC9C7|nr:hypothetical protein [Gluconobacter cerinus]MBS1038119.1 hypothetical protein [Gluconobacter cerinus]